MMDKHLIELRIPDRFRAINSANISIDGITVVSGINGCGKSTISKLLYQTYKYSVNYERILIEEINNNLQPYYDVLNHLLSQMQLLRRQSVLRGIRRWRRISNFDDTTDYFNELSIICQNIVSLEEDMNSRGMQLMSDRLWHILWSALGSEEGDMDLKSNLEKLQSQMKKIVNKWIDKSQARPSSILYNKLKDSFHCDFPNTIEICEFGDSLIGPNSKSVALPHYIQRAIYIDTPMMLGLDGFDFPENWDDLNEELKKPAIENYEGIIKQTIRDEILHGEAEYDEDTLDDAILFKRDDGKVFDLLDCATGLKTFSIIQLLLKNGLLKKDTLLIVDEPEAHLHPQWIVEYARLILLLHKELGVKFFIASHSTDMVGALKEIAPIVDVSDLNFYVAEEASDLCFNYRALGDDVEPIFASFNKSYEKLDYYVKHDKDDE